MNKPDPLGLRPTAEASEWLVRLRDEPNNEAVFNEWLRWREADSANSVAYDRVRNLWHQFDQVEPAGLDESSSKPRSGLDSKLTANGRVRIYALAASCAAIACAIWLTMHWDERGPTSRIARINHSSILPDGSAVDLSARTSVAVDFTAKARLLRLSHGEAYFKVKADPSRPFTVRAGSLDVIAIGTAFDVNHQASRIAVTVQEGMVAVKASGNLRGTAAESWSVAAGYQFIYSEPSATATLSSVDTSAVLAWREGRLEYTRAPLSAVLADINRYSEHPLELRDARVGKLTFTGTVFTDSIGDWISALPGALPVTVHRSTNGKVLLSMSGDVSSSPPAARP